jgi:hypothetical protein
VAHLNGEPPSGNTGREGAVAAGISLYQIATPENFDPVGYGFVNPDVTENMGADPEVLREHFDSHGVHENRRQVNRHVLERVEVLRREKLGRLSLAVPLHETEVMGATMRMALAPDPRLPVSAVPVSDHEYDRQSAEMVDSQPGALFVELGAGLRPTYRSNVVYVEIAAYPTTDVIAFGDALPFESETFDGGMCLSVLEHVQDPWKAAGELIRILKPGAKLIVDWPFLQPVHGYPNHYFNATDRGATETFERLGAEVESYVPSWLHPVFSLHWILDWWQSGLGSTDRDAFMDLSVSDILARDPTSHLTSAWAARLPEEVQRTISAGTRLVVTKR